MPEPETAADTMIQLQDLARQAIDLAKRNAILRDDRDAARAIGEKANELAGRKGMLIVFNAVEGAWTCGKLDMPKDENHFHPGELEAAWDGIGIWRW